MKILKLTFCVLLISFLFSKYSYSMDTIAEQAMLMDPDTGQIILEKNSI